MRQSQGGMDSEAVERGRQFVFHYCCAPVRETSTVGAFIQPNATDSQGLLRAFPNWKIWLLLSECLFDRHGFFGGH